MELQLLKDIVTIVLIKMDYLQKNKLSTAPRFLIILILCFLILIMLTIAHESFSSKQESVDISIVNSSFIPLSNTDGNQIKVNIEYTLENEKLHNQLVNGVMEVYASNGTLIRTTSIPSGFTLQTDGGEHMFRTTIHDMFLKRVSVKVLFTDLSKEIPLSNAVTDDLKLEGVSTTD